MNNSTLNFTAPETSTNSTIQSTGLVGSLDICIHIINFLFGLPTQSYVVWLIITGSRVASGLFNLNLSVCEIGNCLISFISIFNYCTGFSYLTTLSVFLIGLGVTGRPLFQCLICVERYLAVVHPVTFLKYKPLRYRVICCTVAWIITLGCCLCCIYTISLLYIYVCFYSIQFLLFLSIQLFCCMAVLGALKQSGPGERGREREENHMKREAFYLILITTVGMIIFFPVLYLHCVGKISCLFSP
ncbi:uracil nucleotide/cysteinyl leukotriene receptor-like [Rhinichthys klamathensis goyatoka]|uniref:uracil nucleotide/cysteinyl leukotriene receptor-like n=1 Tax=Rhinichthys klamathensis goyatoka TaxID=3034132 RepID=UPI0024B585AF|nr:uracil nucleotide/cysteinyl leukotriene receptor-like [Rhinichthys klamathensis goyatoka]